MKPDQRLYVSAALTPADVIQLSEGQAHYLRTVMRLEAGASVSVFNGRDGEWTAVIESVSKKRADLKCVQQIRKQAHQPNIWLLFAPVKGDRSELIVEKATELGVSGIIPVITQRTIVRKINHQRFIARAIEAAEQCGRLSVPEVLDVHPLSDFLTKPADDELILFADETGGGTPIAHALQPSASRISLLTGPEGGFTPSEIEKLKSRPWVQPIGLGPRILRAETATFAGLSLIQSCWGDWEGALNALPQ
jgi:16S rRNA (uracil1498-N3)-methyltransferase